MHDITAHFIGLENIEYYAFIPPYIALYGDAPWTWTTPPGGGAIGCIRCIGDKPDDYKPAVVEVSLTWTNSQDAWASASVWGVWDKGEYGLDKVDLGTATCNAGLLSHTFSISPDWEHSFLSSGFPFFITASSPSGGNHTLISVFASDPWPEPPSYSRLFRHTGRTVEYTYTAPPPPPYTPPPPVTSSPTPPRPPGRPPVTNVTPPPSNPPGNDVSGRTNRTMVPCSPGPSGEARYSIWETGPNNTLIRQISPCQ